VSLTPHEKRFVAEYPVDFNGKQAAIRAGYSERRAAITASELLKKPEVVDALDVTRRKVVTLLHEDLDARAVDAAYVTLKSRDMVEYGSALVPQRDTFGKIVHDDDGEPVMRMKDWRAADAGLSRLQRLFAEFSEKHEVSGDLRLRTEALVAFAQLPPDQVRALAEAARDRA
jgi:hypothetical protein